MYLDTSVIASLFVQDHHTDRARSILETTLVPLAISDFGAAEFASTINRRVRARELTKTAARSALELFDTWTTRTTIRVEVTSFDIARSDRMLRRLDLNLRTPDAVHLAVAERIMAPLATFDRAMIDCARKLGVKVASS